jgi:(R)-2-hydroxyacyl-CoA dehydratese activating ATPase
MITLGIDAGTRATKAVIANAPKILASVIVPGGKESTELTATQARDQALKKAKLDASQINCIATTGIYADKVAFGKESIPEGVCLAKAMFHLNPNVHSVLDVGAVRALAVRCNNGKLTGFTVNDRCAAGTGAFVEALAAFFKMPVSALSDAAERSTDPADFLNTCAVYVESEALSLLLAGKKPDDLISGALRGFSSRILAFLINLGIENDVAMVGGLARNEALVKYVGENMGAKIFVPKEPETAAALGAALLAAERVACES